MNENFSQKDIENGFYPLRPFQKWILDRNFYKAKSTMMNIGSFMKLHPKIDVDKFVDSINKVLENHDIFRCRFVVHPETGEICQRFDGEIFPVRVENWDDEEFDFLKNTFAEPFILIGKPMYRIYIFKTPSANYFYVDVHHSILDGVSLVMLFAREVDMRYQDKKIKTPASYAELIAEEIKIPHENLELARDFWRNLLKNFGNEKHLPPADISEKPSWNKGEFIYELKNISQQFFRETENKETIFFMAASMISIAKSSNSKKSLLTWIHNGRINSKGLRLFGLMIEQLLIALDFSQNISLAELLQILEKQMADGLKNRNGLDIVYDGGYEDGCATFIFQKKILDFQNFFKFEGYECTVQEIKNNLWSAAQNTLDIEVSLIDEGKYIVAFHYDTGNYSEGTMKNFAELIDKTVLKMQTENIFLNEIFD